MEFYLFFYKYLGVILFISKILVFSVFQL